MNARSDSGDCHSSSPSAGTAYGLTAATTDFASREGVPSWT